MKIAVLLGNYSKVSGGASTYINLISKELSLELGSGNIQYLFFSGLRLINLGKSYEQHIDKKINKFSMAKFNSYVKVFLLNTLYRNNTFVFFYRKLQAAALNIILKLNNVDFVWSLFPISYPLKIPFATTVWDLQHRSQPFWPEFRQSNGWQIRDSAYSNVLPKASLIISGTHFGRKEISHYYNIAMERILVAPFPIGQFQELDTRIRDKNLFFYPAQFWPHKNHYNLILGFKIALESTSKELKLVLPGSDKGSLKEIKKFVSKLGLENNVCFPGFINDSDLKELYLNACGMVYPSYFGPDNLPPLEAISYGCQVATAILPGLDVESNVFDSYFDPDSPIDICNSIIRLRQNLNLERMPSRTSMILERSPKKFCELIEVEMLKINSKLKGREI